MASTTTLAPILTPRGAPGTPFAPLNATMAEKDNALILPYLHFVGKWVCQKHRRYYTHLRYDPESPPGLMIGTSNGSTDAKSFFRQSGINLYFFDKRVPTSFVPLVVVTAEAIYLLTKEGKVYKDGSSGEIDEIDPVRHVGGFLNELRNNMTKLTLPDNEPFTTKDFPFGWAATLGDSRVPKSLKLTMRFKLGEQPGSCVSREAVWKAFAENGEELIMAHQQAVQFGLVSAHWEPKRALAAVIAAQCSGQPASSSSGSSSTQTPCSGCGKVH